MNKKLIIICLLTFFIGCAGGGALAYANHQKGLEAQSLLASISQTQDNWEVEQFIREQEEQRPDGLEESQIATGSRYTGITYNNVSVATVNNTAVNDTANNSESSSALETAASKEKSGLLSGLFGNKNEQSDETSNGNNGNNTATTDNAAEQASYTEKTVGRVAIQSGSLNIRSQGSIDGDVIGQAYKDEIIEIVSQDGAWYQIITANGLQGYVSSTYVELVQN